jgi:hypothetical protein
MLEVVNDPIYARIGRIRPLGHHGSTMKQLKKTKRKTKFGTGNKEFESQDLFSFYTFHSFGSGFLFRIKIEKVI